MKKKFNVNNASIGGGTMKNLLFILAVAALLGAQASPAAAHSALLNCFDNADGTFTCPGGYSDGSSCGTAAALFCKRPVWTPTVR